MPLTPKQLADIADKLALRMTRSAGTDGRQIRLGLGAAAVFNAVRRVAYRASATVTDVLEAAETALKEQAAMDAKRAGGDDYQEGAKEIVDALRRALGLAPQEGDT